MKSEKHAAPIFGFAAEFDTEEKLMTALRKARDAGHSKIEVCSPYPLKGLSDGTDREVRFFSATALAAISVGALLGYALPYYTSVLDYPLNVGNRPLNSVPAFLIFAIELAILAAAGSLTGLFLWRSRLFRLFHPVTRLSEFKRASVDRFFLVLETSEGLFDERDTRAWLEQLSPGKVYEIER